MIQIIRHGKGPMGRVVRPGQPIKYAPITPVGPLYGVRVDDYSNGFIRAYWNPANHSGDMYDGQYHTLEFSLATAGTTGPGGTPFADTAAIRANGGVAWWDNNGVLGKIILRQNNKPPEHEMTADEMADAIDAAAGLIVKPEGVNLIVVGIFSTQAPAPAPAPPPALMIETGPAPTKKKGSKRK